MKIAIIGAGNMGGAIAKGLAKGQFCKAADIICTAHSQATLDRLQKENPQLTLTRDNVEATQAADYIVLAVKPWKMEEVMAEIRPVIDPQRHQIVSVAAGISFEQLENWITGEQAQMPCPPLFRIIPNTAIEVGYSVTFVAASKATEEQTEIVMKMFEELGYSWLIEEKQIPAATALASCGIAFAFRYIRANMEGGVEMGIPAAQAQRIVAQTMIGAAQLLLEKNSHPEAEIDKVTTPGGITIKGINELDHQGFNSAVIKALKACL